MSLAKKQRVGSRTRLDCPNCGWGTNTKAAIVNHNPKYYSIYCNACNLLETESKGNLTLKELSELKQMNAEAYTPCKVQLPLDFTFEIPYEGRQWLYQTGLSPTRWQALGIGWSDTTKRVILPVYNKEMKLVWLQQRAVFLGQKPKYIQPKQAKEVTYTNFNPSIARVAVIVEDIASAMRINEIPILCDGHSIMGTSLSLPQINVLCQYWKVLVWFDPDKPGQTAAKKAIKKLSLWTDVGKIYSTVDPKKLCNTDIINLILQASIKEN